MSKTKVAFTIEEHLLQRLDSLVSARIFPNRSKAIQKAVEEKLSRMNHSRLARECSKLIPGFEQALAEEGISEEAGQWPEY